VISVDNGLYNLQSNEWNSSAPLTVCNDGNVDFTVSSTGISNATDGAPGAYPSLYRGCHWGDCTSGSGLPIQVSAMDGGGVVSTSYSTTTVSGGAYDDSYDIWFNQATSTSDNSANGLELMIWLNHNGSVQPAGSVVASDVSIGGNTYNVWYSGTAPGGTVSYVLANPATSVSNLDLGPLAADAVARGYMPASWYLIDVEAGFEIWQGGQGLTADSFSLSAG
jgi:cellulose 1,4-beta-cellobiosidase